MRAPMAGHHYTVGAMKHHCRDRSWIGHIWLVLETNGKAAVIADPFAAPKGYGAKPMIVDVAEFDWTPADELAEAMSRENSLTAAPDPAPTPSSARGGALDRNGEG